MPPASTWRRPSAELRREHRHRHAARRADRRRDGPRRRRLPRRLRVRHAAALERRRIPRRQTEQLDLTRNDAKTWLYRNNFKLADDGRGALARQVEPLRPASSSLGDFYNGEYTEAVLGYAYRPVRNDRLNTMVEVHVLLQRADDGAGDARSTPRRVHPEEPHRGGGRDVRPDAAWAIGGKYAYRSAR